MTKKVETKKTVGRPRLTEKEKAARAKARKATKELEKVVKGKSARPELVKDQYHVLAEEVANLAGQVAVLKSQVRPLLVEYNKSLTARALDAISAKNQTVIERLLAPWRNV